MAPFLRMTGITKRFPGVIANDGVDLVVERGEVHGLLGENGAGKTTLMNILYGLHQPDEGSIEVDGSPVRLRSPRGSMAHGIGMVHQHFMLVPDMTVAENVALGLRTGRSPLARLGEVSARITDLSRRYGLLVDPDDRIEDLSVGMQQRVEILKLLYRGAQLLVLDEPTSVLTPQEWEDLSAVLRSLVAEGRSAIFITHKLEELLSVADRCTVLRNGKVVGTIEDASATDKATLARMMVGRDVVLRVQRPPVVPGAPVLEVGGLSLEARTGVRASTRCRSRSARARSSAWPASTATGKTSWSTCSSACASRPPGRSGSRASQRPPSHRGSSPATTAPWSRPTGTGRHARSTCP